MEKRIYVALAIALFLGVFPARGRCQAAAEYSITTSHTATATIKAGSALDKATQRLAGHLSDKVSKPTEQLQPTGQRPSRAPADRTLAANAPAIDSAHGIEVVCGPGDAKPADTREKAASQSAPCVSSAGTGTAGSKTSSPSKPTSQAQHPSVVNLSFSK